MAASAAQSPEPAQAARHPHFGNGHQRQAQDRVQAPRMAGAGFLRKHGIQRQGDSKLPGRNRPATAVVPGSSSTSSVGGREHRSPGIPFGPLHTLTSKLSSAASSLASPARRRPSTAWHTATPGARPWYRGSYAYWRPGQYTTVAGYESVAEGDIHFCGDHTSYNWQGLMEGALRSGERAARELTRQLS